MPIAIEKLKPHDLEKFMSLVRVFEEVFEMKDFRIPPAGHLQKLLMKPDFMAFVALKDQQVIAGLTAYVLDQYYAERPLAYIYDLAVLSQHQRKGVGKQLIAGFTGFCRDRGFEEVFVQADKVDDYALSFYRATQVTAEEQVVHFYYRLDKR